MLFTINFDIYLYFICIFISPKTGRQKNKQKTKINTQQERETHWRYAYI